MVMSKIIHVVHKINVWLASEYGEYTIASVETTFSYNRWSIAL